jgi:hypothetical protein
VNGHHNMGSLANTVWRNGPGEDRNLSITCELYVFLDTDAMRQDRWIGSIGKSPFILRPSKGISHPSDMR